eukprot:3464818-Alexandrium_andersonii.AAC.1
MVTRVLVSVKKRLACRAGWRVGGICPTRTDKRTNSMSRKVNWSHAALQVACAQDMAHISANLKCRNAYMFTSAWARVPRTKLQQCMCSP